MAYMLTVATRQLRYPVPHRILMKTDDALLHWMAGPSPADNLQFDTTCCAPDPRSIWPASLARSRGAFTAQSTPPPATPRT
jgi:hypothetical protein